MAAKPPAVPGLEKLSLTSWLDAVLGFFADQAKISKEDYVSQTGGEWLASGVEFVCDMFTKGILNKAIHAVLGGVAGTYAIWGSPPNKRLQKELISMSNHALTRILDPKPSDIVELRKSIDDLVSALQRGDMKGVADALLRSPDELKGVLSALGMPSVAQLGAPAPRATVVKPPTVTAPPPPTTPIPPPATAGTRFKVVK